MVTEFCPMPLTATVEMAGAAGVPEVVKELFVEDEVALETLADVTEKLYVVPGLRPVKGSEWKIATVEPWFACRPYAVVNPKFTTDVAFTSVTQLMLAVVLPTGNAEIDEMTGAPTADVANVAFAEVPDTLLEFAETTSKLYVVPAAKPVSVTECEVTSAVFRIEAEP
jgi:hypothetical protein